MNKILSRYICIQFIPPFLGGLALFSFIMLMDKVLRLTDLFIVKGVELSSIGRVLLFLFPPLLSFTIPMALLFSALMTFGRLSSDNEMTALRSCGIHPFRMIAPVLFISLLCLFLCLWFEIGIIPPSYKALRDLLFSLQQQRGILSLTEKSFQDLGEGVVAFVNKEKGIHAYQGVLICDQHDDGTPRVIVAKEGEISFDLPQEKITISLTNGSIHNLYPEEEKVYDMIQFGRYDMGLPFHASSIGEKDRIHLEELSMESLSSSIKASTDDKKMKRDLLVEWHRRFAFPVACLIFVFLGSLIGMESKWSGRGSSFALSLVCILLYYFLLTLGKRMTMAGYLSPWIGVWLSNLIFLCICLVLIKEAV